jgi:hypothetical protein
MENIFYGFTVQDALYLGCQPTERNKIKCQFKNDRPLLVRTGTVFGERHRTQFLNM